MIRYIILLVLCVCCYDANTTEIPTPKFEAFRPKGIRVTLPNIDGISEFFLWGNVNVPLEGNDLGSIQLQTYEPTNGVWLIEDMDIQLKPGDTIYYTFFINLNGVIHRLERQQYTVQEIIDIPSTTTTTTTPKPATTTTTTSTTPKPTTTTTTTTTTPKPTTTTTTTTPQPTTTTTTPPPTTTTTTTPKPTTTTPVPDQKVCVDDTIIVKIHDDKTVVTTLDNTGKELPGIEEKNCDKSLVIDFNNGEIKFS